MLKVYNKIMMGKISERFSEDEIADETNGLDWTLLRGHSEWI